MASEGQTEATRRGSPARRRGLVRKLVTAVLGAAVAVAGGVWLLLHNINYYRDEVSQWMVGLVGHPVSIGHLETDWDGRRIELRMRDVTLHGNEPAQTLLHLAQASVSVDVIESLSEARFVPGPLTISGASIVLIRRPDGTFEAQSMAGPEGESTGAPTGGQRNAFAKWLLMRGEIHLESTTLLWDDRSRDVSPVLLTGVSLHTRFEGEQHRILGAATLPAELGQRIEFELDLRGDLLSSDWSGQARLRAQDINVAALQSARSQNFNPVSGRLSVDLDTAWDRTRLRRARIEYVVQGLRIDGSATSLTIQSARGMVDAERRGDGWDLNVDSQALETANGAWSPAIARLSYQEETDDTLSVAGSVSFARIEDVMPLLLAHAPAEQRSRLASVSPTGELLASEFSFRGSANRIETLQIETDVERLSVPAHGTRAGFENLSGHFSADLKRGTFTLNERPLTLTLPNVLPKPIELARIGGTLAWRRWGTGFWFDTEGITFTHPSFSGKLAGKLHWPYGNDLPIADVALQLLDVDLGRLGDFLPIGALRRGLATWLERSIKSGRADEAQLSFQGFVGDFPFRGAADSFKARAHLHDVELDYSPLWPKLEALQGGIVVDGFQMSFEATGGSVLGAAIEGGTATLADLRAPQSVLEVKTHITGTAEAGLRFLRDFGLKERFGVLASRVDVDGQVGVALNLSVPLPRGSGKKVAIGDIELSGNTLQFKTAKMRLDQATGKLSFSPGSVSAAGVEASYLDTPVRLEVGRHPTQPKVTSIVMTGTADPAFLIKQLHSFALFRDPDDPPRVVSRLSGSTPWKAVIDLPDGWGKTSTEAPLRVESDLRGLDLGLPHPFDKTPVEAKSFVAQSAISTEPERDVSIRYGEDVASHFELVRSETEGGYRMVRGAVTFGNAPPELPPGEGLYVAGSLRELSFDEWSQIVSGENPPAPRQPTPGEESAYPILRVLKEVDIRTGTLHLLGHTLDDTHVLLRRNDEGHWIAAVDGDSALGSIVLPEPGTGAPIVADFERLALRSQAQPPATRRDPRRALPVRFSCDQLVRNDVTLGSIELTTSHETTGVKIESLHVVNEDFDATATGAWSMDDAEQERSKLVTQMKARDLGALLQRFGYSGDLTAGGTTDLLATLAWNGSPGGFTLAELSGVVGIRVANGRLLDVKPGAIGRVFGLMMFTALPRRLRLDFSDLFGEGFEYDLIEGSFALEDGHAYTSNLVLESKAAKIEVAGRAGLVAEDYDQVVTVTPHLTSSIPLVPLWLIEKMVQAPVFNRVFSYQYTVVGPWDDPKVERIILESDTRRQD